MMNRLLALALAASLFVTACGTDAADPDGTTTTAGSAASTEAPMVDGMQLAIADAPRAEPAGLDDPAVTVVATADLDFGLDLLRTSGEANENLFLSPYSIASALGMLAAGARGETLDEIAAVIGADDLGVYHDGRNGVEAAVEAPGVVPGEGDAEVFTLRAVNQLFGQDGFEITGEYLDVLARFYAAGVQLVDFVGAPEPSRILINDWVEEQTEDRITDLIPEGVITVDTRIVLTNAVYFKANWLNRFDPANTAPGEFAAPAGTVTVDMMNGSVRTQYAAGDGWQAVRLPYMGGTTSMMVIVPDDLDGFLSAADAATIASIRGALSEHQVEMAMPKFEFTTDIGLKPVLQTLGIEQAFLAPGPEAGADLTGMHPERVLYVEDALHKAFVSVDEEGTEAAAATAVVIALESLPPPATMRVDRPFMIIIENDATGEPIFLGLVADPTAG